MSWPSKRLLEVLIIFCFLAAHARADTLKDPEGARALAERIMTKVGAGDTEGGMQLMRPFLIVPPAEFDVMIEQMKMQQPVFTQRFGKSIGHEFIREDRAGNNLLRIVEIHRFEKHVMRWTFYFYRGSEGWVLNTFLTDDGMTHLFGN